MSDQGNHGTPRDIAALLAAWRQQGADRLDPLRFDTLQAMSHRAASLQGQAGELLARRMAQLASHYARRLSANQDRDAAMAPFTGGQDAGRHAVAGPGTLAQLSAALEHGARTSGLRPGDAASAPMEPPAALVEFFRDTWTRLSARRQVRQSLRNVPGNAGPLNSDHLIHRALTVMQQTSPAYLEQFLTYLDALSWLATVAPAQDGSRGDGSAREAARAAPARKAGRTRAKKSP